MSSPPSTWTVTAAGNPSDKYSTYTTLTVDDRPIQDRPNYRTRRRVKKLTGGFKKDCKCRLRHVS